MGECSKEMMSPRSTGGAGVGGRHASRDPRASADLKCWWTSCEDRDSFPHECTSLLREDSGNWSLCLCVAQGRSETEDPRGVWKLLYLSGLSRLEQPLPVWSSTGSPPVSPAWKSKELREWGMLPVQEPGQGRTRTDICNICSWL